MSHVRKLARVIHDAIRPIKRAIILAAREPRRINVPRKNARYIRESRGISSWNRMSTERGVLWRDDGLHRCERKTQTLLSSVTGMWTSSRDALSDFAAVSDWQLRHRYCVPGEIDCRIARGREKDCLPGDSYRENAMRSIDHALRCNYSRQEWYITKNGRVRFAPAIN